MAAELLDRLSPAARALLALAETNRKGRWQKRCRAQTRRAVAALVNREGSLAQWLDADAAEATAAELLRRCSICRRCPGP